MYMKTERDLRTEIFYLKDYCCNINPTVEIIKGAKTSREKQSEESSLAFGMSFVCFRCAGPFLVEACILLDTVRR